jgi:hypothetical protein
MNLLRGARLRGLYPVVTVLVLAAGMIAGALLLARSGGEEETPPPEEQVQHEPTTAGWQPVAVATPDDRYVLRASVEGEGGIARETSFVLESRARDLEADALRDRLVIEPAFDYDVTGGANRLTIRPSSPLRAGAAYRFTLLDPGDGRQLRSWAFQTESPLRVVQTLPGDAATNVPLDTGIELTFSHDGVTGVEERFSISPPVEGRFETNKRVVVFVPKALQPETLYTVTLAPGVTVAGAEPRMAEPFTFSFETGSTNRQEYLDAYQQGIGFTRLVSESATSEPPILQVIISGLSDPASVPVEVYRYPGADGFVGAIDEAGRVPFWSYFARRDFRLSTEGLDRVATFTTDTVVPPTQSYARYLVFPDALEPGFYLVQADWDRTGIPEGQRVPPAQALLQVTDLASYASVSTTKTLVWVNDLATGAPVEGAQVEDTDGDTHDTGADGVALFDTPPDLAQQPAYRPYEKPSSSRQPRARVLRVEQAGRTAIVPLDAGAAIGLSGYYYYSPRGSDGYYPYYSGGSGEYWTYLYTDRGLYRKTDEVNFWGIARRRENFKAGETFTARLTSAYGYYDSQYQPAVLAETPVTISDTGTFRGSLPFSGASADSYQLQIVDGDGNTITQAYVQMQDFITPAYRIDITPERRAMIHGETINVDVTTNFFDGSPAPGVELAYSGFVGGGAPVEQTLTTDDEGSASITHTAVGGPPLDGPQIQQAYARPTGPEAGEINGNSAIIVVPAALTADVETAVQDGRASVSGTVYNVDLSKLEDAEDQYYYTGQAGYYGDPVPGRTVTANVTDITYDKVETGEYYDFIAKLTRKTYEYRERANPLPPVDLVSGADGSYAFDFPVQPEHWYRIEIYVRDDQGRTGGATTSVSGDFIDYRPYINDTNLQVQEKGRATPSYYYVEPKRWSEGDQVELQVTRGGGLAESGEGYRYLYTQAQNGLRDYTVLSSAAYAFEFAAADVPSVYVDAVQFNGRGYELAAAPYLARYQQDDRDLDVRVTPDRDRYEPGGEVTLSVETRDKAGDPVAAEVLLSAVDEAIFRVGGYYSYEPDMMEELYAPVPPGVLQNYVPSFATAKDLFAPPQRGGGDGRAAAQPPDTGGQPGSARTNIRDIALFETVRTDGDGRGSITFTLPDNITSWRVTSRALTADLFGGGSVTNLPSGLPFFVDVTSNTEYLTSDRPLISLRAFGRDLRRGDTVEYTITAPSLGIEGATVSAPAFTGAAFELPPLTEGEHEITVQGRSGELRDGLVRKIRVVPSRLQRAEASFTELGAGTELPGASGGTTRVVFTDQSRGRYYADLMRLSATWGDRLDQMLARNIAQDLLKEQFGAETFWSPATFDAALYQTDDGGLALFPYAGSDLLLSVRALSVAPDRFERERLAQYFRAIVDDPRETRERAIIALFGLAAAGEPVLPSIAGAAAEPDLSVRERLYLGLAALAAGDEDLARGQYRGVMLRFGEQREPYVRVRTGTDQDDILEATALAAGLAAGLGDPAAAGLFDYTMANSTTALLVELEQVSFLARAVPRLPSQPVKFSYMLNGERREETLENGRSFSLVVSPPQLASLDAQAIEGRVGVATYFRAPFDPASAQVDPDVSITRVIDNGGDGVISPNDVVTVRLDYTLGPQSLDGCYEIVDIAPSGLRPITQPRRYIQGDFLLWPYRIDGQAVHFCASKGAAYPAEYWARVVTPGAYTAEPATIQSMQSAQSFNLTESQTVDIAAP